MANLKNNTVVQHIHYRPGKKDSLIVLPPGKVTAIDDKHLSDAYIKDLIAKGVLTPVAVEAVEETEEEKPKGKGK